jgi:hypothetical protein
MSIQASLNNALVQFNHLLTTNRLVDRVNDADERAKEAVEQASKVARAQEEAKYQVAKEQEEADIARQETAADIEAQ